MKETAALARAITWSSSKQTYYTARLMVDRDLVDDFFRAYAYFRWADDMIDIRAETADQRLAFTHRQKLLIDGLYAGEAMSDLALEERILADLVASDRYVDSGLQSFIRKMFAIIEFDAGRKGRPVSAAELTWYTEVLGQSVIDGIQYFVGNRHRYARDAHKYLAGIAAHISHLLRDTLQDVADGFFNIPVEYLEAHALGPAQVDAPAIREWVQEQVARARRGFRLGKEYINAMGVLRCKIVAHWYCARFEAVLDAIEGDHYLLRSEYPEQRSLITWVKMLKLAAGITLRHLTGSRLPAVG